MKDKKAKYLNSHLSVEVRVKDLIKSMTLEEKITQLGAIYSPDDILEGGKFSFEKARKVMGNGIGQLSDILRPFAPREGAKLANDIQKFAVEHTRLGIPVIIHEECLHGCMAKGSTSFPQSIGLASTWNPELIEKVAVIIGQEARARGIQQAISPTINIITNLLAGDTTMLT